MTVELIGSPESRSLSLLGARPSKGALANSTVWYATAAIALGLAYYHWQYEGWRETIIFAGSITAALVFALTFLSRRILFSITLIALLIATIVIASGIKHHYIEMVLHAYDVVFYLTSWSTLVYLWVEHKSMLLAIIGMMMIAAASGLLLWKSDSSRDSAPDQRQPVRPLRGSCCLGKLRKRPAKQYAFLLGPPLCLFFLFVVVGDASDVMEGPVVRRIEVAAAAAI